MKQIRTSIMWLLAAGLLFAGCLDDDRATIGLEEAILSVASENPVVTSPTTVVPNIQTVVEQQSGNAQLKIYMTGISTADGTGWLDLYGTGTPNQNVWVSIDDVPRAVSVANNSDGSSGVSIKTDLVFVVDNSGSMDDEADGIARDIIDWATQLEASHLDIRFGCVGYGGNVGNEYTYLVDNYGVTGALNLTTRSAMSDYLSRSSGTSRTMGYSGSDASRLQSVAMEDLYNKAGGECGVQAVRFADENFSFRAGATRVYVNFTDDANYTGGNSAISVSYINGHWRPGQGTIHSVLSNSRSYIEERAGRDNAEQPWLVSEYTGGTTWFVASDFSGVTLADLPVTGAMSHSYILTINNVGDLLDGQSHRVHVTIISRDGGVRADKVFNVVFQS